MVLIGPHPAHSQTREAPRQLLPHRRMFQSYLTVHVGLHGSQWGSNPPPPPRWDGSARAGGGSAESTRSDPGLQQMSTQEPAISPDWPGGVKELGAGMDPPGHWITPAEIPLGLPERRRGWRWRLGRGWGRRGGGAGSPAGATRDHPHAPADQFQTTGGVWASTAGPDWFGGSEGHTEPLVSGQQSPSLRQILYGS